LGSSYKQWLLLARYNLPINSIVTAVLLSFQVLMINSLFASFVVAEGQQQQYTNTPITLIPGLTQNVLTIVSLLIGTSSFILGLRIQNLARSTSSSSSSSIIMNKYFDLLILALAIPSIIIIIFGIILVGNKLDPGDFAYLLLLFALFIPAGVVLFLVKKLHMISSKEHQK
jgi:nitrogen fixation/metabolism regulation signal transduction histidine kinase